MRFHPRRSSSNCASCTIAGSWLVAGHHFSSDFGHDCLSRPSLLLLLAVLKLGLCLLLVAAAMHLLRLGLWSLRQSARPACPPAPPLTDYPVVTVQLPMYNERTVAARAIAAACALDLAGAARAGAR